MSKETEIITFGCRLNAYESEVMRGHLQQPRDRALVVVNTCAVTAEAERQARQAIRKAARERPDAEIVVTGCAAQIDPESYAKLPGVTRVLGNDEKLKPESWAAEASPGVVVGDIMTVKETASHLTAAFTQRARAFVQIQQGCDHRCTFCIIPFGRGNNRSVPLGAIVQEVRRQVEAGIAEVVLTGVDITGYGSDLPGRPSLGQLCRRLLAQVPELPRLRLSSLDPVEIDADLYALLAREPRLMPHLHLSVQAGSDLILKRMKRRHLRADVLACVDRAKQARPDLVFGADLIAGFPTETPEAFAETLALVQEANLTHLHIFPYSERAGTPAARMPQVAKAERKARAAALRRLGQAQLARHLSRQIGSHVTLLMEAPDQGRAEDFTLVSLPGASVSAGTLVSARITALSPAGLIAVPVGEPGEGRHAA
ncbi:MAG: tRNA (N(6)-L-threonylcarbamoyladenosine(37)-C(2))-methylthiotransferase MtaB [Pseudomonadota bacterium]